MRLLFFIFTLIVYTQQAVAVDGYTRYHNDRYGYSIDYPKDLLFPQGESDNGDGQQFLSKNADARLLVYASYNVLEQSLEAIYSEQSRGGTPEDPEKVVTYHVLKNNWFVISGYDKGKIFYQKTFLHDNTLSTFVFEYDEHQRVRYDAVTEHLVESFTD